MQIQHYFSLVKFSHTVFALPFALIGFLLALDYTDTTPDALLALLVLACMVFARTAAMAFNRFADYRSDALNPRTQQREIPSGKVSPKTAFVLTLLSSAAFVACTWFINEICFYLSPVALLVILGYSYSKRITRWSHLILGIGLGLAPVGSFLAVSGEFALLPVLLGFTVLCWVAGFDIIYALQDEDFDRNSGLKSLPAIFGARKALWISIILHFFSLTALFIFGILGGYGFLFWAGFVAFAALLIHQHLIVKAGDLSRVNAAFFTSNGLAGILLSIFFLLDFFCFA